MNLLKKTLYLFTCILCIILISSGCSFTITAGYNKTEANAEEEIVLEYDIELLEAELDQLIDVLIGADEEVEINEALQGFYENSHLELACVYYADSLGEFYLIPATPLPEGYDARTRPWYKAAVEQGVYLSEPYLDYETSNSIITISKPVLKNEIVIGVGSMDVIVKKGGGN